MDYNLMWGKILTVFPILDKIHNEKETYCTEEEFQEALDVIKTLKFEQQIESLVFNAIEKDLRQLIVPKFWSYFVIAENDMSCFTQFKNAVEGLYNDLSAYVPFINKVDQLKNSLSSTSEALDQFKLTIRATLLSQLPPYHTKILESFYEVSFRVFCKLDSGQMDSNSEEIQCSGCMIDSEQCQCQKIYEIFCETNRRLVELNLLEPLVGQVLTSLIHVRIENHIQQLCKGSFDVSYTQRLEKWLNYVVMYWLKRIYCEESNAQQYDSNFHDSMNKFHQKLTHFLYETYTMTRINQLFNIVIDFPESLPAVKDLHTCLPKTDLRPVLIQKFQRALETRLLHPGVSTPDILTAYVAAIRALRELDPSGMLLDLVTQPIHQYLRSREDTVRCVVGSLTEEGPSDLADELVMSEALHLDENCPEEDEGENWETWKPEPVDAVAEKNTKNHRTSDIISMLVNVYGSKELFVNEYKTLLANRLLSQYACNTEKEIRYLELLKLRFGESQLHYCEVMLKDIGDSKRINAHLQKDPEYILESKCFPVSAMILSAQFWPAFKEETLDLPAIIKDQFQFYTNGFETLKGNRTLCWKPHLGSVELDIELKDRTLNLTVSPIHATIIIHFEYQEQWTVEDLSQVMKVPATQLRKKMTFWQSQGLVKEVSTDVFLLVVESASKGKGLGTSDIVCEEDESESAMASYQDQREEELQVFWSYIIGMLTNLDSMTLERIHQMLKMFASQGSTAIECSLQELRVFLDRKVREHKLVLIGGYYRLPKA